MNILRSFHLHVPRSSCLEIYCQERNFQLRESMISIQILPPFPVFRSQYFFHEIIPHPHLNPVSNRVIYPNYTRSGEPRDQSKCLDPVQTRWSIQLQLPSPSMIEPVWIMMLPQILKPKPKTWMM